MVKKAVFSCFLDFVVEYLSMGAINFFPSVDLVKKLLKIFRVKLREYLCM